MKQLLAINRQIDLSKVGIVDLGTLKWVYDGEEGRFYTRSLSFIGASSYTTIPNAICSSLTVDNQSNLNDLVNDKAICLSSDNNLIKAYISDSGTDATAFKAAMSGVYLAYETND